MVRCTYCGRNCTLLALNKKYCLRCEENCYRECIRCHRPLDKPSFYSLHPQRCNGCHRKYLKEIMKRKQEGAYLSEEEENIEIPSSPSSIEEDNNETAAGSSSSSSYSPPSSPPATSSGGGLAKKKKLTGKKKKHQTKTQTIALEEDEDTDAVSETGEDVKKKRVKLALPKKSVSHAGKAALNRANTAAAAAVKNHQPSSTTTAIGKHFTALIEAFADKSAVGSNSIPIPTSSSIEKVINAVAKSGSGGAVTTTPSRENEDNNGPDNAPEKKKPGPKPGSKRKTPTAVKRTSSPDSNGNGEITFLPVTIPNSQGGGHLYLPLLLARRK